MSFQKCSYTFYCVRVPAFLRWAAAAAVIVVLTTFCSAPLTPVLMFPNTTALLNLHLNFQKQITSSLKKFFFFLRFLPSLFDVSLQSLYSIMFKGGTCSQHNRFRPLHLSVPTESSAGICHVRNFHKSHLFGTQSLHSDLHVSTQD